MSKTIKKKKIAAREKAWLKRAKPTIVKNLLKDHICKNCHWSHFEYWQLNYCSNSVRIRRHKNYPPYLKSMPFPKEDSCQYWGKWDKYA